MTALILLAVVPLATGSPMMPKQSRVADPLRSLSGIDQLLLHVTTAGEDLHMVGLSLEGIREAVAQRCTQAGIEIVEEDAIEIPVLHLEAIVLTEPRVADAVAYEIRLSMNQMVRLQRFEEPLRVPTYYIVYTGLEHRDDVTTLAPRNLRILINRFLQERRDGTG